MGETTLDRSEIVVGTDGTATALRAVAWAAAEARARGAALRILHAAPYATPAAPAGRRRAAGILGRAHAIAHQREPQLDIVVEQLDQQPADALLRASDQAELLVIGLISGTSGQVVLGSLAYSVTAQARCPVTVVHSNERTLAPSLPVVVGVQDVSADAPAIALAFADAERHGTGLIVVHVRHGSLRERITGGKNDEHAATSIAEELSEWRAGHPAVPVDVRVLHGNPAVALMEVAEQSRLAVVASHSHGPAARAVLGSTSQALLRLCPCPVTVVQRKSVVADDATASTGVAERR